MGPGIKLFIRSIALLSSLVIFSSNADAQMLNDPPAVKMVKQGISYMYNFQFEDARAISKEISQKYPDHPANLLLSSVITYWENYPMLPSSPARSTFEKGLRNCIEICGNKEEGDYDAEYLLIDLCARGLLLLYLSDNEITFDLFPLAISTYPFIRKSFQYISKFYDFNYFAGVFDYYREEYPEFYPVYKPLAALFPKGNKIRGLHELNLAADSSIFLRAESLSVLEDILLRFENKSQEATYCNKTLYDLYPANPEYRDEYIKNLLLIKEYDKAENLIKTADTSNENPFFRAQMAILEGILQEKKYRDFEHAEEYYKKGIEDIKPFGKYADEYSAYAYFGLSRISDANGDKHLKKSYRRKANSLSDFKKINFD